MCTSARHEKVSELLLSIIEVTALTRPVAADNDKKFSSKFCLSVPNPATATLTETAGTDLTERSEITKTLTRGSGTSWVGGSLPSVGGSYNSKSRGLQDQSHVLVT